MAASSNPSPPGLSGRLYRYRTSPNSLQAFESPANHDFDGRFLVFLGGLTDGLLACSYVDSLLAGECERLGWALVQPVLSSSYIGYGTGSLDRDSDELEQLLGYLATERQAKAVVLCGHSTGCQDTVHFLRHARPERRRLVRGAVLQAPVSDREAATIGHDAEDNAATLDRAREMIAAGRGSEIVTMHYGFCPITAERFVSLVGKGGPDDLFSSDFTDGELASRLAHLSTVGQRANGCAEHPGLRTLFALSLADEYVPSTVDAVLLAQRFVAAAGGAPDVTALELPGASHNLSMPADGSQARAFVGAIGALLGAINAEL